MEEGNEYRDDAESQSRRGEESRCIYKDKLNFRVSVRCPVSHQMMRAAQSSLKTMMQCHLLKQREHRTRHALKLNRHCSFPSTAG